MTTQDRAKQNEDKAEKIKLHLELMAEINFSTKRLEKDTQSNFKRIITLDQLTLGDWSTRKGNK